MSLKKMIVVMLVAALTVASPVFAQSDSTDDSSIWSSLTDLGVNAAQGWMGPFVTVFGTGMNAGWYNSSKSYSFLKLPVGFSVGAVNLPIVVIDDDMRTFDFSGDLPLKAMLEPVMPISLDSLNSVVTGISTADPTMAALIQTQLGINPDSLGIESEVAFTAADQPTLFGPDSSGSVTMSELLDSTKTLYTIQAYNMITGQVSAADTIDLSTEIPLPFSGMDAPSMLPSVPGVGFHIGVSKIPVINNLTLGFRFLPAIEVGDFGKIGQFGMKIQHEITPHLPIADKIPFLHLSGYWAMNNLGIEAGPVEINQNNWVAMLNVSADAKFLLGAGLFMGIGMESSNLALKVDMPEESGLEDFELDIAGENGLRFQIGPRLSLGIFDIWADANFGAVTSYNVGITALGLNGL